MVQGVSSEISRQPTSRALVTGAAGFIGAHLVDTLLDTGIEVVGVDNERSGDWSRVDTRCERVSGDISLMSADDFARATAGCDVVYHLAAEKYNSSLSTPSRVIDTNISATQRLIEGASASGVRKIVFTSSLYAYGSLGPEAMSETDVPLPRTMYGLSKLAGEHLLRVAGLSSGLEWAAARLFFTYGTRQYAEGGYKSVIVANFERLRDGDRPLIVGDGLQVLDYIHVSDVVAGLIRLAGPEYREVVVNIGSGIGPTINELTATMCEVAGLPCRPVNGPPDWTAGSRRVADVALMQSMGLGVSVDLASGLREFWEWLNRNG